MSTLPVSGIPRVRPAYGEPGAAELVRTAINPAVSIGSLALSAFAFGEHFDGPYMILALLVLLLMAPGEPGRRRNPGQLFRAIVLTWGGVAGLLIVLGWAPGALAVFHSGALATWVLVTPPLLFAVHSLARRLLARLQSARGARKKAILAVWNEAGRGFAMRINSTPALGIDVAGFFDDRDDSRIDHGGCALRLGQLPQLADYVKSHPVDVIYIALSMASQPRIHRLVDALRDTTASIYFVPDISQFDLIQARVETIGGMPVLAVCESPFRGSDAVLKRATDIVLSAAFLTMFAPLMLAIAIGVKLSSPGPVLFRQRRHGLDGREIVIYKFRSMRGLDDDGAIRQAVRRDPRVTPFGAFLRASSLDELPQFLNVLQGRMSVVGPRPHALSQNETYRKLISGYMIRHKVKPGITGLAQVNGARGETDTVDKMRLRVEYDLEYLRGWSLQLDILILLKTVVVVLNRRNAY